MASIVLPGSRTRRATLDQAVVDTDDSAVETGKSAVDSDKPTIDTDKPTVEPAADALVVICPPDPRQGGNRHHPLLRTMSEALTGRGIDCLRFDYGPFDEGRGECADAAAAIDWAADRATNVGIVGYSFGGAVAIRVAADCDSIIGWSAIAPAATLSVGGNTADMIDRIGSSTPGQVIYGSHDRTVDWMPTIEQANKIGIETVECAAGHSFAGQTGRVADAVGEFFERRLR